MTPTHDELVAFAAGKLGIHLIEGNLYVDGGNTGKLKPFNLTSWDLMGKGMKACEIKHILLIKLDNVTWRVQVGGYYNNQIAETNFGNLPLAFWTAWYKLEKESECKT